MHPGSLLHRPACTDRKPARSRLSLPTLSIGEKICNSRLFTSMQGWMLHSRGRTERWRDIGAWILILLGLTVLYAQPFFDLFDAARQSDRYAHVPVVFAVGMWFVVNRVRQILRDGKPDRRPAPVAGTITLALGLACYVFGRSQSLRAIEIGSLLPTLAGIVLIFQGTKTLSRLWPALLILGIAIPLPASIMDAVTEPMKIGASRIAEQMLHWCGYPVARSGVILYLGQYQLLVADACSGLHSLFVLEALGLLYGGSIRHYSWSRNLLMAMLIVPLALFANALRIVALALVTYHLGDTAGQGFLHDSTGLVFFVATLLLVIAVDGVLGKIWSAAPRPGSPAMRAIGPGRMAHSATGALPIAPGHATAALLAMLFASAAAAALTPTADTVRKVPDLEQAIPARFGSWQEIPSPYLNVAPGTAFDGERTTDQPYDRSLLRTYTDRNGTTIMLAIAYAAQQYQDIKIHLPEVCYRAQGFQVMDQESVQIPLPSRHENIPGQQFVARNGRRMEAVSYWMRIGDEFPRDAWGMRTAILRSSFMGTVDDGVVVRASSIIDGSADAAAAYQRQRQFLAELVNATTGGPDVLTRRQ